MFANLARNPTGHSSGRTPIEISCVVPMHNEEANASLFLQQLAATLAELTDRYEIVVVNDGSRDQTRRIALGIAARCRVVYFELSRNFGKEAALTAGLDAARGEAVVIMDADFQHPFEALARMVAKWREGYEMVYGVRIDRSEQSHVRSLAARLFYRLVRAGSEVDLPDGAGDFRLLDRKVVDALKAMPERTRFMKGLYAWVGFRSVPLEFEVQPRAAGESSFRLKQLLRLAITGTTAFSTLPLRWASAAGVLVSLGALAYGAWVTVQELVYGIDLPGYPTIVVSIMAFAGLQLISLGIIGEYLARVFDEVKQRPNYIVAEAIDFTAADVAAAEHVPDERCRVHAPA